MDSVMRLCSDLQQNSTPFQLSVKIVGSVDFHLSTMPGQKDENENNRSSRTWHQRGPSYLRRQLKRSLEKKLKKSPESCEDNVMTRRDSGGGTTPTKMPDEPAKNAEQTSVPEQSMVTKNDSEVVATPNLGGEAARELEVGGGRRQRVAKEKEKSDIQLR